MTEFGELERIVPPARANRPARVRTDRELLVAARAGSQEAIEALVARHWDRAHRIALGVLADTHFAEDVTQETMVSILANLSRFDARRSFEPWLHRIVINRSLDWARARARREEIATLVGPPSEESLPDRALVEALAALPIEQRAVVVLRHVAGYGTNEIARMLGVRRGTVGSRLRRGLDRLRTELEAENG